jgi:protein TonB
MLLALIGKDGIVRQLSLTQASLDAVKQWRYRPYIFDGEAMAVQTRITVTFHLAGD